MVPPPRELVSDVISEILLRLPPDEPEWLFRAALVCKPWLCILSDPAFLRRYRDFHGAPPLLGLVDHEKAAVTEGQAPCYVPTTAVPAFPIPDSDGTSFARNLDCRHGRVLTMIGQRSLYYLVCDPVTGDSRRVPDQGMRILFMFGFYSAAAVFCAAAGCDHLDCHGGPFCLVCLYSCHKSSTMSAAMYSSEIGAWSAPVELDNVHMCPTAVVP